MFLLNALGRMFGFGKNEQKQDSPSSRSPPQDGFFRDEPRVHVSPFSFTNYSRENLSNHDYLYTSSAKNSSPQVPQSKASSSNNPSLATVSSTKISISEARIPPDSSTKLAEKPSSSSTSLPLSKRDAISPAPPSIPPPIHILSANNSVPRQKNKQISTEPSRESMQSLPPSSQSLMKVVCPDSKLAEKPSSSSTSHPLSKRDAISPAPPSIPPPIHILSANNSVPRQKNKQISTEPSRESMQSLPPSSQSLMKVVCPDSSSSTNASSPSSLLEFGLSNRRLIPKYEIPKYLEEMIRNDTVPPVLTSPLCPSTYSDFFATLLYAEDFYLEKWSKYLLKGIKLELLQITNSNNSQESSMERKNTMQDHSDFVAFKIDSVPERRPYLLSRDFVFLKPLNEIAGPFKGRLFRVVKSTTVLVEFGDDFHSQHFPSKTYDVSFSFNRICLKRAHQAISIASDSSFHGFLFPGQIVPYLPNTSQVLHGNKIQFQDHVRRICNHKSRIPYLVNGQLVQQRGPHNQSDYDTKLSFTGLIIQDAMLSIYRSNPRCRILVCSPTNKTSDVLLRSLKKEIPESMLFRANAAYRNYDNVPDDIIPSSLYEEDEECFACPPLAELLDFNIITCTFISSFRLFAAGIVSGHFTHIFLLDASSAIEPEAIVPLAHLANRETVIVVSGCAYNSPSWVRADIARRHGLKKSYFNRLLEMELYTRNDSMFISHLA